MLLNEFFIDVKFQIVFLTILTILILKIKKTYTLMRNFLLILDSRIVSWASLVAQWLRICLPMQGTWVRALVWEDPPCRGATKPTCYNYWEPMCCKLQSPRDLEPAHHNYRTHVPWSLHTTTRERNPACHNREKPKCCNERSRVLQLRPNTAKKVKKNLKINK